MWRSACRRSLPASTSIPRSRWRSRSTRALRLVEAARAQGPAHRLRARHLPRRLAPDRAQADRRRRDRDAGRRAPPSSCAPATSAGIPTRTSTTKPGGGPMLDMGPYYLTDLVNLLGPVARVAGVATSACAQRARSPASRAPGRDDSRSRCRRTSPARSNSSPARSVTITMSFDVPEAPPLPIEIYGSDGHAARARPELVRRRRSSSRPEKDEWTDVPQTASLRRRQLPLARPRRHGAGDPRGPAAPRQRPSWRCTCSRSWRPSGAPADERPADRPRTTRARGRRRCAKIFAFGQARLKERSA